MDPFGLSLRRAAIFFASAFIVLSLHDVVMRELRGTPTFSGVRSTVEGVVLLALCVMPAAVAGFWRHRAARIGPLIIFAMAAGYIAAFLGVVALAEPLAPGPRRFVGLAITFLGPYLAIMLGVQVLEARSTIRSKP